MAFPYTCRTTSNRKQGKEFNLDKAISLIGVNYLAIMILRFFEITNSMIVITQSISTSNNLSPNAMNFLQLDIMSISTILMLTGKNYQFLITQEG